MEIMKAEAEAAKPGDKEEKPEDKSLFSQENLPKDSSVRSEEAASSPSVNLGLAKKEVFLTSDDKVAFIDSVVNNTRFERTYSLFGGRIALKLRSLTSEEVQAIAAWALKEGTHDPAAQIAGRHRKYLLAAHVARFNGTDMPPLETPLFETLGKDGKTMEKPGWVDRSSFWDAQGAGIVQAVLDCVQDFDAKYATLCSKAEDENFWRPDTH